MVASIGELGQPSLRIPFEGTPLNLWQDVRYGERMLRKSPGFTITAVLTLGLGIGATTAVFSVCDALLWKPIALPHLESLVMVLERDPGDPNDWNSGVAADLDDIRRESTSLQGLATWQGGMANIVGVGGEPERAIQTLVSANFFATFGVQPVLGRGFQEGEDPAGPGAEGGGGRPPVAPPLRRRPRRRRPEHPPGRPEFPGHRRDAGQLRFSDGHRTAGAGW